MAGQKTTLDFLREYNLKPLKSLGQNFLIDDNINRYIIENLELSENDLVLEIGAGLGELVNLMKDKAGLVLALEIDKGLSNLLRERFTGDNKVKVMEEDILKCDLSGLVKNHGFKELVIVGNLPYYISSPIVFHLIKYRRIIKKAVIMLQKEVAQRLVAKVNSKDYGILSCLLDYYAWRQIIKVVKNSCFMPVPKVDSAIVELSFYKNSHIKVNDEVNFVKVVKTAFSQRRKTILNTLSSPSYDKQQLSLLLDSIGIKPSRRPQELTAEEFAKIANKLI